MFNLLLNFKRGTQKGSLPGVIHREQLGVLKGNRCWFDLEISRSSIVLPSWVFALKYREPGENFNLIIKPVQHYRENIIR